MYKKFESFTEAFPQKEPDRPPNTLLAFCLHYTKGFEKPLILLALMSTTIAIIEVSLFGFMGQLVDWLSGSNPETFLADNKDTLMGLSGRIATKVMQTSLAIRETVMKTLDVFVYVAVYFTAMVVMLAQADWRLMLPTVKLFSHSKRETEYAEEGMGSFLDTVYRQMRLVTGFNVCVELANYILVFVISAMSIYLWMQSAISVGSIAIAIALALRINGMSKWIMWEVGGLFENMGTVVDGMQMLSKPIDIQDDKDAKDLVVTQGAIEFNDVSFHYGENKGVIDHLNLHIKAGEKVGLVGRSGAGKSTLVNLLLRFHDVESGEIKIDGQNISKVTQDSLRSAIGMVTQDTSLLHRSIRDNILYSRPDATEEDLLKATKQAHAHEFITDLTDPHGNVGYDAQVGERGVKLSGGQRQRIAISRVLLKDAPLLVLCHSGKFA